MYNYKTIIKLKLKDMNNKQILHDWVAKVWNHTDSKTNIDAIHQLFAEEGIAYGVHNADGTVVKGPKQFEEYFRTFTDSFKDVEMVIEDMIAEDDKVSSRCKLSMTHSGKPFSTGTPNPIAPSGKRIEITGITFVRIEDGKVVEAWNQFDFLSMFMQLGAIQML